MYLLIFLEMLLVVAVVMTFIMKRKITGLLRENAELYEKIYQLKNADKEKALESDEPYWQHLDLSAFVDERVKEIVPF